MKTANEIRKITVSDGYESLEKKVGFWIEDEAKKGFNEVNFLPILEYPLDVKDWLTSELVAKGYNVDDNGTLYMVSW